MVQYRDLEVLLCALNEFETTESVSGLDLGLLEATCARVLAESPLEPLAFRMEPILAHARELEALSD
ncbi:hypothetical protein [Pseudomonas sp.]|uniref:hypothetical protein n=1 Tax=Pseudomonas sp. TaxID=306 RepID=UPI003D0E5A48